jgi:phage gp29-like protein
MATNMAVKPVVAGIPCQKIIRVNRLPRLSFPSKNRENTAVFTEHFSRLQTTSKLTWRREKNVFYLQKN